jgi:nitric oxide reductase subunit B
MTLTSAQTITVIQLRMALACVVIAVLGGVLSALHYVPALSPALHEAGFGLTKLRPLHTTFASVWIFGGCVAVMYHYLANEAGGLSRGDTRRFWFHTACWITAGIGIVITLALGVFTGREYIGLHPAFSVLMLLGWFAFAINFLRRALPGFWSKPVYMYFWTTGVLYFVYTFVEGHAYLLPSVQEYPLRDINLHWKSCGTLVGSFNFLVYGSLIYISERLTGDRKYGQSGIAFMLFGVGCLNSFTNYAHHTYHVPQSHLVKWIAFVVSMTEVVILAKIMFDLVKALRKRAPAGRYDATLGFLVAAKWWTMVMLFFSILISVPTLNSLIHGTHMVTGHAMGTELGIDSMVLFGAITFLLTDLYRRCPSVCAQLHAPRMRSFTVVLNVAMAVLVAWLSVSGTVHGIYRYYGEASPAWVGWSKFVFPVTGTVLALVLLHLVARWSPLLWDVLARAQRDAAIPAPSLAVDPAALGRD